MARLNSSRRLFRLLSLHSSTRPPVIHLKELIRNHIIHPLLMIFGLSALQSPSPLLLILNTSTSTYKLRIPSNIGTPSIQSNMPCLRKPRLHSAHMLQNHPQSPNSRALHVSLSLNIFLHLTPRSLQRRPQIPPHLIMIPLLHTHPITRTR